MSAHRLSLGITRLSYFARSPRRRAGRAAALASTLALTAGTALVLLPSAAAAEECPNAAFRTGPSAHLPDCRAYEMVSPPFKGSGSAYVGPISQSGSSLLLFVTGGFGGIEGFSTLYNPNPTGVYETQRTASGWVSAPQDLSATEYLPAIFGKFNVLSGYGSEDGPDNLLVAWLSREASQPNNRLDFFARRSDHSVVDIGPALPSTAPAGSSDDGGGAFGYGFSPSAQLSGNASRYFFTLSQNHWPFDGTLEGDVSLYEYLGTGNTTPLLVGVDNSGALISQCGTQLGEPNGLFDYQSHSNYGHNAVSTDGNTVFFTVAPCNGGPPVEELFARIDNGLPDAHTVAISEPSEEDCSACDTEAGVLAGARFRGASEDGRKVFFVTKQPLLGSDTSENLYEYDFDAPAGERVVRVTAGDATVSNPAPGLLALSLQVGPMNSEDGSHMYFLATGVLTTTPNGEGEAAAGGADNLYVFERDARFPGGHVAFVARLSPADLSQAGFSTVGFVPDMTPDGRFLVFASGRDLTPDDTSTARQIFEYDAQTGGLVRMSIGQDGFNHNGNVPATFYRFGQSDAAHIVSPAAELTAAPGLSFNYYSSATYQSRLSVSADGSYVFFQSPVGLTPQAFDRKVLKIDELGEPVLANNVYEYHDGTVSLISDGQDVSSVTYEPIVELIGTDASGRDVFFQTVDPLVGQDTDTNVNVYDARIDGGFPAPVARPSCSGDACQGALSGAPVLLSPGSEFQAGGNPPLAGESAVTKPKAKQKAKPKAKKRRSKGGKRARRERAHGKAKGAAVGGRTNRKAGRS